ncbi:hypothetical protein [Scrofimicrobium canadense]|nr:hypothetical protein [Scrofimicrobium canadense]
MSDPTWFDGVKTIGVDDSPTSNAASPTPEDSNTNYSPFHEEPF